MIKKQRATQAVSLLATQYPNASCSLSYTHPYELLIAVRLSAQCTDARVNIVAPVLFGQFSSLHALANASYEQVGEIIKSCGLYKTKAKDIVELSKMLIRDYESVLPETVEELTKLPGIGRKSANLIVGDIYKKPAVVCDTHCIRITNLLGLTTGKNPLTCENELRKCLPMEEANDFCHRLVLHGRAVCKARKPLCHECSMAPVCSHAQRMKSSDSSHKKLINT